MGLDGPGEDGAEDLSTMLRGPAAAASSAVAAFGSTSRVGMTVPITKLSGTAVTSKGLLAIAPLDDDEDFFAKFKIGGDSDDEDMVEKPKPKPQPKKRKVALSDDEDENEDGQQTVADCQMADDASLSTQHQTAEGATGVAAAPESGPCDRVLVEGDQQVDLCVVAAASDNHASLSMANQVARGSPGSSHLGLESAICLTAPRPAGTEQVAGPAFNEREPSTSSQGLALLKTQLLPDEHSASNRDPANVKLAEDVLVAGAAPLAHSHALTTPCAAVHLQPAVKLLTAPAPFKTPALSTLSAHTLSQATSDPDTQCPASTGHMPLHKAAPATSVPTRNEAQQEALLPETQLLSPASADSFILPSPAPKPKPMPVLSPWVCGEAEKKAGPIITMTDISGTEKPPGSGKAGGNHDSAQQRQSGEQAGLRSSGRVTRASGGTPANSSGAPLPGKALAQPFNRSGGALTTVPSQVRQASVAKALDGSTQVRVSGGTAVSLVRHSGEAPLQPTQMAAEDGTQPAIVASPGAIAASLVRSTGKDTCTGVSVAPHRTALTLPAPMVTNAVLSTAAPQASVVLVAKPHVPCLAASQSATAIQVKASAPLPAASSAITVLLTKAPMPPVASLPATTHKLTKASAPPLAAPPASTAVLFKVPAHASAASHGTVVKSLERKHTAALSIPTSNNNNTGVDTSVPGDSGPAATAPHGLKQVTFQQAPIRLTAIGAPSLGKVQGVGTTSALAHNGSTEVAPCFSSARSRGLGVATHSDNTPSLAMAYTVPAVAAASGGRSAHHASVQHHAATPSFTTVIQLEPEVACGPRSPALIALSMAESALDGPRATPGPVPLNEKKQLTPAVTLTASLGPGAPSPAAPLASVPVAFLKHMEPAPFTDAPQPVTATTSANAPCPSSAPIVLAIPLGSAATPTPVAHKLQALTVAPSYEANIPLGYGTSGPPSDIPSRHATSIAPGYETSGSPSGQAVIGRASGEMGGTLELDTPTPLALDAASYMERLEVMLLQASQAKMDLLSVRAQAAIMRNRLVRLDNPMLRARISEVSARQQDAAAVKLPDPLSMA